MDTSAGHEMIAIAPGEVRLSDRRTQRVWSVELAPYRLGAFPVTRMLYAQVTGLRPSAADEDHLPVADISWWDAVRFCNALSRRDGLAPAYDLDGDGEDIERVEWDTSANGYRLPTEAEWEHACRAGTTGPHYGPLDEIAWYRANSHDRIHHVGGKLPNPWGLHDMLGNVWEWCWDTYDQRSTAPTECCAAAAGSTNTGAAAPPYDAAATRPSRSTTWASAWHAPARADSRGSSSPTARCTEWEDAPAAGPVVERPHPGVSVRAWRVAAS